LLEILFHFFHEKSHRLKVSKSLIIFWNFRNSSVAQQFHFFLPEIIAKFATQKKSTKIFVPNFNLFFDFFMDFNLNFLFEID
jgi:hypothetical protein